MTSYQNVNYSLHQLEINKCIHCLIRLLLKVLIILLLYNEYIIITGEENIFNLSVISFLKLQ